MTAAAPTSTPSTAETRRIALLGCGGIGRAHAQAVTEVSGAALVAVSDVDPEAARAPSPR